VKTNHDWKITSNRKEIKYSWCKNKQWQYISVLANNQAMDMKENSLEEYIFEHYYGYTKINNQLTEEYKISHPRWYLNNITKFDIECNFKLNYGDAFAFLNNEKPITVFIAEGSKVAVNWKRNKIVSYERC
jgi:hypothetical protein